MSLSTNFPNQWPTLLLDFANTERLDPRITFTRASPAVYYDGITTAVAEQNLYFNSTDILNATYWGLNQVVRTGGQAAPDGTSTAFSLVEFAASGEKTIFVTAASIISALANTDYTTSVFFRPNGRNFAAIRIWQSGGQNYTRVFDISTGALAGQNTNGTIVTGVTSTITAFSGGWYRCSVTWRVNANSSMYPSFNISNTGTPTFDTNGGPTYLGDGTSGIFVWGMQTEQRSTATSYTPTTTAPVTNFVPRLLTASADTARFDHNPATGASLGLLIEEARTNLEPVSNTTPGVWTGGVLTTAYANQLIAPDATQTSTLYTRSKGNGNGFYRPNPVTLPASGTWRCFSVYVRKINWRFVGIRLAGSVMFDGTSGAQHAVFDFDTGDWTPNFVSRPNFTGSNGALFKQDCGNGWWRLGVARVNWNPTSETGTIGYYGICACESATNGAETWDSTSAANAAWIASWGAQYETASQPSSFIQTSGSSVPRSADVAVMTGTNFSSWYNNAEGTLYGEASSYTNTSASGNPVAVATIGDGGSNNRIQIRYNNNVTQFAGRMVANGASILATGGGAVTQNVFYKQAVAYQSGSTVAVGSGAVYETNTSPYLLVGVNTLQIGIGSVSDPLNGYVSKIAYYDSRLTNAQTVALTRG